MKEGRVTKGKEWNQYYAPGLDLEKNNRPNYSGYANCGSCALSLITGLAPNTVNRSCPKPKQGWYTGQMIKYLQKKGYMVIEVSKNSLLNTNWLNSRLTNAHCLLINARVDINENSAYVLHAGEIWHNFNKMERNGPLFFFKQPHTGCFIGLSRKLVCRD